MIVAISSESGMVSHHFGRTPQFTFVEFDSGKAVGEKVLDNPGSVQHQPGLVPQFIKENGADWIVAGGMGPMAVNMFEQWGIQVVVGITGSVREVVEKIEAGTLEGGRSLCEHANERARAS
ncbi:MAG: NifB/NifX family molybdenum-iron cluster-binding protein [Promethearchaeota archaeon]